MTMRHFPQEFNFSQDIAEPQIMIKGLKSNRTKFIKDLNYKSLAQLKQTKTYNAIESSKQKEFLINKQRSRKNNQNPLQTLLQKVIPNAKIIKAEWKQNKLHGNVQIQYDNGNHFIGKYHNGVRVQGKLTYHQQKCVYEGLFFAQKFSGLGKLTYDGGRVIEGEWDNMEIVGNATITYPNKDVYYGSVNQKLFKHGQGYLFLHSGYKYVGSFENGSINGLGSYFDHDKLIVKGIWQKGRLIRQLDTQQQTISTQLTIQTIIPKSLPDSSKFHQQNPSHHLNYQQPQSSSQKLNQQQYQHLF